MQNHDTLARHHHDHLYLDEDIHVLLQFHDVHENAIFTDKRYNKTHVYVQTHTIITAIHNSESISYPKQLQIRYDMNIYIIVLTFLLMVTSSFFSFSYFSPAFNSGSSSYCVFCLNFLFNNNEG